MRIRLTISLALLSILPLSAGAHCQIPCGIYGDGDRFSTLLEHVATIGKSVEIIEVMAAQEEHNPNQLVRWIMNKEEHATKIQRIASDYFLAQRIKEGQEHYVEKLKLLHAIIVSAMKTKQTADASQVKILESNIKGFKSLYLGH